MENKTKKFLQILVYHLPYTKNLETIESINFEDNKSSVAEMKWFVFPLIENIGGKR